MQMTPYAKALQERVERGMKYLQKHGRMATQEELGPMPTLQEFPDRLDELQALMEEEAEASAYEENDIESTRLQNKLERQKKSRSQKKSYQKSRTGLVGVYKRPVKTGPPWIASWWQDGRCHNRYFATALEAATYRNEIMTQLFPGQNDKLCNLDKVAKVYGPVITG